MEERGAPTLGLPTPRRDVKGAGARTPPRRDADGHGGLRAPGTQLRQQGTRVAPQIFPESGVPDVSTDRRNVPWSPENVLIDTVARLQQDLADIRAESRQFRTPGSHMLCRPFGRLHLRRLKYPGLRIRPVGTNIVRC